MMYFLVALAVVAAFSFGRFCERRHLERISLDDYCKDELTREADNRRARAQEWVI